MSDASALTWTPAQEQALERCYAALEAEADRQDRVLALCQEQGRAARLRDIDALESATRELAKTMESVLRAEAQRIAAVMDAARGLGLTPDDLRLSRLVSAAPEPWRAQLSALQRRIRTTTGVTQRIVEANGRYLQSGARTAERLLAEVFGKDESTDAYTREGRTPGAAPRPNALLNVAG